MKRVRRPIQFETNKSNYTMIGFELVRKNNPTPTMNSDSVKEMFPDWADAGEPLYVTHEKFEWT